MDVIDFAKAFDEVPRHRWIETVAGHGISGEFLSWSRAWLSNRPSRQRVCVTEWSEILTEGSFNITYHSGCYGRKRSASVPISLFRI